MTSKQPSDDVAVVISYSREHPETVGKVQHLPRGKARELVQEGRARYATEADQPAKEEPDKAPAGDGDADKRPAHGRRAG